MILQTKKGLLLLLALAMVMSGTKEKILSSEETNYQLEPSEDSHVSQLNSNSNYGKDEVMSVRSYRSNAGSLNHRIYIKFDLTDLGKHHVATATLRLFKYVEGAQAEIRRINVVTVVEPWNETTINWANQPRIVEKPISSMQVGAAMNWYECDVTVAVQSWKDNALENNGFCLLDSKEDSPVDYASVFLSREAVEMYMYRPRLVVQLREEASFEIDGIDRSLLLASAVIVATIAVVVVVKTKIGRFWPRSNIVAIGRSVA